MLIIEHTGWPLGYFLDKTMGWDALTSRGATMVPVAATHEELIRRTASRTIGDIIMATLRRQTDR